MRAESGSRPRREAPHRQRRRACRLAMVKRHGNTTLFRQQPGRRRSTRTRHDRCRSSGLADGLLGLVVTCSNTGQTPHLDSRDGLSSRDRRKHRNPGALRDDAPRAANERTGTTFPVIDRRQTGPAFDAAHLTGHRRPGYQDSIMRRAGRGSLRTQASWRQCRMITDEICVRTKSSGTSGRQVQFHGNKRRRSRWNKRCSHRLGTITHLWASIDLKQVGVDRWSKLKLLD